MQQLPLCMHINTTTHEWCPMILEPSTRSLKQSMFVVQGVQIYATTDILIHLVSATPQDIHTQHKYTPGNNHNPL